MAGLGGLGVSIGDNTHGAIHGGGVEKSRMRAGITAGGSKKAAR